MYYVIGNKRIKLVLLFNLIYDKGNQRVFVVYFLQVQDDYMRTILFKIEIGGMKNGIN